MGSLDTLLRLRRAEARAAQETLSSATRATQQARERLQQLQQRHLAVPISRRATAQALAERERYERRVRNAILHRQNAVEQCRRLEAQAREALIDAVVRCKTLERLIERLGKRREKVAGRPRRANVAGDG